MNKEARPLTQEQRKEFVQLLKDAKVRVLETLSSRFFKRSPKAWDLAVRELVEKLGAKGLFEKVEAAQEVLKKSEKDIRNLGFQFNGKGDFELTSEGGNRYNDELTERRSQILDDEAETARKKYETAILNVLATESVEEAKALVEPLV